MQTGIHVKMNFGNLRNPSRCPCAFLEMKQETKYDYYFFFQKLRFNFQCLIPFSQEVLATRFLSPSETVVLCGAAICVGYGRHTGKTRDNGSLVNICQRGDRWNQPLQDLLLERYRGDRLCPAPAYATDMPVGAAAPACLTCGCAARWHNARHPRGCCDNSRSKCSKAL